ncbi:uncharacterized protein PAC_06412 [Phialocephala subalpina]|uniref:FAD linked oxidase N-terminal domain-containing protein n=1 Tax=Phialocephala subalpina TaxID=576137 RepID=A0A1L7WUY3_9HELO|nr:uncharacterized protein PAC_06412 [Phialocephala subalpina]
MVDPTSPMSPIWQGRTCEPPFIAPFPEGTCTLGGLPSYSINATPVAQIQAGINFARNAGIRLVIKNTGHDFSGKSTGAGSLLGRECRLERFTRPLRRMVRLLLEVKAKLLE